jgi:hypothetical protein
MRRHDDTNTISVALSPSEAVVVDRMKEAGGIGSDANLMRVALWSLADHMGVDMPNGVFDLRQHIGNSKRRNLKKKKVQEDIPNPQVKQDKPWKAPKPKRSHPWRAYQTPPPEGMKIG